MLALTPLNSFCRGVFSPLLTVLMLTFPVLAEACITPIVGELTILVEDKIPPTCNILLARKKERKKVVRELFYKQGIHGVSDKELSSNLDIFYKYFLDTDWLSGEQAQAVLEFPLTNFTRKWLLLNPRVEIEALGLNWSEKISHFPRLVEFEVKEKFLTVKYPISYSQTCQNDFTAKLCIHLKKPAGIYKVKPSDAIQLITLKTILGEI